MKRLAVLLALLGLLAACSNSASPIEGNIDDALAPTVIKGTEVNPPGKYPWMAMLKHPNNVRSDNSDGFICGGSLVASSWILTAAHCAELPIAGYTVVLGQHKRGVGDGTEQYYKVNQIFVHPSYRSGSSDGNDIALLHLSTPAKLNGSVGIVSLASSRPAVGTDMTVIGWGRTEKGNTSDTLLEAGLPIAEKSKCERVYGPIITDNMICARKTALVTVAKPGACNGDSGGPLFRGRTQSGIVSWGKNDCKTFGVYTDVSRYRGWISGIINPNPPPLPQPPSTSSFTVSYSSNTSGVQTLRGTTSFNCPTAGSCKGTAPTNQVVTIIAYGSKASQGFWSGCVATRTVNGGGKECDIKVQPNKSVSVF